MPPVHFGGNFGERDILRPANGKHGRDCYGARIVASSRATRAALNERNTGAARLFIAFWQDSAQDNPVEIARVSAVSLFTQHNIRYVEYFSKCLYYAELYPSFTPRVCRADPTPRDGRVAPPLTAPRNFWRSQTILA